MSVSSSVSLLFFLFGQFVPVLSPICLCVYDFSGDFIVLSGESIHACAFSGRSIYLCLLWLLCYSFWWFYLCLCLLRWAYVSIPSPIALLFFLLDLFVPADESMPLTAGPLFFLVSLFILYALSGGTLFFLLSLFVFALSSIVSLFLLSMDLFIFQRGGLVTSVGIYIFHGEYVTFCGFLQKGNIYSDTN